MAWTAYELSLAVWLIPRLLLYHTFLIAQVTRHLLIGVEAVEVIGYSFKAAVSHLCSPQPLLAFICQHHPLPAPQGSWYGLLVLKRYKTKIKELLNLREQLGFLEILGSFLVIVICRPKFTAPAGTEFGQRVKVRHKPLKTH